MRFLMLLGCKLNQGSKLQCEGTIPRRKIVRGEKGKEMPSRVVKNGFSLESNDLTTLLLSCMMSTFGTFK